MALFTKYELKVLLAITLITVGVYLSYLKLIKIDSQETNFISFHDYITSFNNNLDRDAFEEENFYEYALSKVNSTQTGDNLTKQIILFSQGVTNQDVLLSSLCIKHGISHIYFNINQLSCIDLHAIKLFNLQLNEIKTLYITLYSITNSHHTNHVHLSKLRSIDFLEDMSSRLCIDLISHKASYALRFDLTYKIKNNVKLDNRRLCFNQLIGYY